jgi:hypothetical protein
MEVILFFLAQACVDLGDQRPAKCFSFLENTIVSDMARRELSRDGIESKRLAGR